MDHEQITQLANAFRNGNRASFKILVESLSRSLIAMAFRYTADWETSRDLTQETWIRVHERIDRYDPSRPFLPWLHAIHRHGCLSWMRRPSYRREEQVDPQRLSRIPVPSGEEDPHERLVRMEFARRILQAVGSLTENQRRVFVHVDLEQIKQRDAAELLSMDFTTLRTTLHFARRRLAEILKKRGE